MATITPIGEFVSVTRQASFEQIFNINLAAAEQIIRVTCTAVERQDRGVTITTSPTQVVIKGSYLDSGFKDEITYVSKGSSDSLETPKTVIGIGNVPSNQDMYSFIGDTSPDKRIEYVITIELSNNITQSANVWHYIRNDWSSGGEFVRAYYAT